jgi:hypothetical protein
LKYNTLVKLSGTVFSGFILNVLKITSRACGNVGKSSRFLARLFQAAVGIRVLCGFPRARHFHQAGVSLSQIQNLWRALLFIPTNSTEDPFI